MEHFKRYHGYDYSRGFAIFQTFHLEPRVSCLGKITPDGRMNLSLVGQLLKETIQKENERTREIQIMRYCIMPDHVHLRTYVRPGQRDPLRLLGQQVSNIKRWSRVKAEKNGVNIQWQKNYHDLICVSRTIIEKVDAYIDQNPLKWALMHTPDAPMKVVEPLDSLLLPADYWWQGVGNIQLIYSLQRIVALRLSRSLPMDNAQWFIQDLLNRYQGAIIASTFISPMERELFKALSQRSLPMIRIMPDALKHVYKPTVEELPTMLQQILLVLSYGIALPSQTEAWNLANKLASSIATASGGEAHYYSLKFHP